MEADDVELQLALQCAPLITGLKISNLLTISSDGFCLVEEDHLKEVLFPCIRYWKRKKKQSYCCIKRNGWRKYLRMPQVKKLLREAGYESDRLEDILPVFCDRYETYTERGKPFPHELGLLLGYPPEDVEGFIRHQGKNSLCTGYWKVYADKEGKQRLFEKYEYARENLIQLLHYGLKMTEIIDICGCTAA